MIKPIPLLLALWLGLLFPAPAPGNPQARFDPKGNDLAELARQDSLLRLEAAEKERARLENRLAYAEAIRLNEPAGECIAWHSRSRKCLFTVQEFNRYAEAAHPEPDSLNAAPGLPEAEAVRIRLLSGLLRDPYLEDQLAGADKRDSLEAELQGMQARKMENYRQGPVDSTLRALYRRYRSRLFQSRKETLFQVLGSSDSAYADSLWRVAARAPTPDFSARDSLPWQTLRDADLRPEVGPILDSIPPGKIPKPIRTRFGFVLVRVRSQRVVPEIPFEQAIPLLGSLISLPGGKNPRTETALAAYYHSHYESFLAPDTVLVKAWLLPGFKRKRGGFAREIEAGIRRKETVADTLKVAPLSMPLSFLPEEIRPKPGFRYFSAGTFFGPVNSTWGTWYFRILERKPAHRHLTFEEARPELLGLLFPGQERDSLERARLLADAKWKDIRSKVMSEYLAEKFQPSPDRLAALEKSPRADSLAHTGSDASASEQRAMLRSMLAGEESRRRQDEDFAAWMRREVSFQFIHP
ncbi:MAG TPA: hypothetical protein VJ385_14055 [Fibrobacteria bacterium]|nr:hypothetical protein [Fibrobacteria bacterium]